MLINVKMPTIIVILTFMNMTNFMVSRVEHESSFITLGPDIITRLAQGYITFFMFNSLGHIIISFYKYQNTNT